MQCYQYIFEQAMRDPDLTAFGRITDLPRSNADGSLLIWDFIANSSYSWDTVLKTCILGFGGS